MGRVNSECTIFRAICRRVALGTTCSTGPHWLKSGKVMGSGTTRPGATGVRPSPGMVLLLGRTLPPTTGDAFDIVEGMRLPGPVLLGSEINAQFAGTSARGRSGQYPPHCRLRCRSVYLRAALWPRQP